MKWALRRLVQALTAQDPGPVLRPAQGNSVIWALPFLFVFTGGVFADLLETERRVLVRIMLVSLIAVQALAAIWTTVLNANLSG